MSAHDEDATFITLWQTGIETTEIARRLGIKSTTAQSRARRLQQRGLIAPRPRGGEYPSVRAKGRLPQTEVSPDTHRVSPDTLGMSTDTPGVQYLPPRQESMQPVLQEILLELRQLTGALATRVSS